MLRSVPLWLLSMLVLANSAGCATPMEPFLHRAHRENYALQVSELKEMQFYLSAQVLAHEIGDRATRGSPEAIFMADRETPGVVIDAGPNWLRVSFDEGPGVRFLALPDRGKEAAYWLATEVDGHMSLERLRDQSEPLLRIGDRQFRLILGTRARLLINSDDLQRAIQRKRRAGGRTVD